MSPELRFPEGISDQTDHQHTFPLPLVCPSRDPVVREKLNFLPLLFRVFNAYSMTS